MSDLLPAAYDRAETFLECALSPQTITATFDIQDVGGYRAEEWNNLDQWSGRLRWELPRGPIIGSITSVIDANGHAVSFQRHTAGNADFIIPLQPILASQCPITVVYQAGFTTIPPSILQAIRVDVATSYMVRENTSNLAANPIHKIEEFYRFKGRGTILA
jgi:hypothetical protein